MFAECVVYCCVVWCLAVRCVGGELCMWSCERSSGAVCPRELCAWRARAYRYTIIIPYLRRTRARAREREMSCDDVRTCTRPRRTPHVILPRTCHRTLQGFMCLGFLLVHRHRPWARGHAHLISWHLTAPPEQQSPPALHPPPWDASEAKHTPEPIRGPTAAPRLSLARLSGKRPGPPGNRESIATPTPGQTSLLA